MTKIIKIAINSYGYGSPVNTGVLTKKSSSLSFPEFSFNAKTPAIDSFKIRIPFSKINVLNDVLSDNYVIVSEKTGDIIDDENFKKSAYFHKSKGIKTYYRIESQMTKDLIVAEYLTILVTSKLLKYDYFEGITGNTLQQLYINLIDHEVVYFSYRDFLDGECTDMDIKTDIVPKVPAIKLISNLYECAIPRKQAHQAASVYKRKDNLGIQFALRKTKSFKKYPYLKFYEKVRELHSKSFEFYNEYLSNIELPEEILRAETTIKNKKHFKLLGQLETSLESIIDNLDSIATNAFNLAFQAHLSDYKPLSIPESTDTEKFDLMDKVLLGYIYEKMINGLPFKEAMVLIVKGTCSDKKQRYRLRKKIKRLEKHINFSNLIGENTGSFTAWYSQVFEKIMYN